MTRTGVERNANLRAVINVIEEVYKHYPRMELSQLRVLLRVLDRPGSRASELAALTGLSKSALSRAIRVLGSEPYHADGDGTKKAGLNLITQIEDVMDARARLIAPTRLGRRFAEVIDIELGDLSNGKTAGQSLASGRKDD